ncbi:MAG: hypothetical protein FWH48_06790 [Oscillospiraceae bacterium]|nr:hypothetical protein [Oscillospiraceae bacterium]
MTNREYIKSKIDTLPEEIITKIAKIMQSEKAKRNEEYVSMLDRSHVEIAEGRGIAFTMEELESMTEMPIEEAKAFASERAMEKGIKLWQ